MSKVDITAIIEIAWQAGRLVLETYEQSSFAVTTKIDHSVLTKADMDSHTFIYNSLRKLYPSIPVISEESVSEHDYAIRKDWEYFFLVDPLDGTKEFIQRNGEFTVNIALIKNDQPILGVVHAPAIAVSYYAEKNKGVFKIANDELIRLPSQSDANNSIRAVVSRSHHCIQTESYLNELQQRGKQVKVITSGSALKFGLIAEGVADIYPRFAPTMEWDTAAGHILIKEAGKQITIVNDNQPLRYNKLSLVNPGFIVQ